MYSGSQGRMAKRGGTDAKHGATEDADEDDNEGKDDGDDEDVVRSWD